MYQTRIKTSIIRLLITMLLLQLNCLQKLPCKQDYQHPARENQPEKEREVMRQKSVKGPSPRIP